MYDRVLTYFDSTISRDFFSLFCGRKLGSGTARVVYECAVRPDLVVKIETISQSFQNAMEWEFWSQWNHEKDVFKWLAPCVDISPCGAILLQKRTQPVPEGRYPDKMPKFLTDMKRSNYGLIGRQIVCHDYGFTITQAPVALQKAEWWDPT